MLQLSNEPDDEELGLGWGGIHLDTGALNIHGYGLVQDINETDDGVAITLTADAAQKAGVDPVIQIEIETKPLDSITLGEAVRRFKARLLF